MTQPVWQYVHDSHVSDDGGGFVYIDTTGAYAPELEILETNYDGDGWLAYRVVLEQFQLVGDCIVPTGYDPSWPEPVHSYEPFWAEVLPAIEQCYGQAIKAALLGADVRERAWAYECLADYCGADLFDHEPARILNCDDLAQRYHRGELG